MKALISHHGWHMIGGAEFVNAAFVVASKELGYDPIIVSGFKFDPKKYIDWFGIDLRGIPAVMFPSRSFSPVLLYSYTTAWAILKYKPDLVFVDSAMYKPVLPLKRRYGFRLIEYIHFPFEKWWDNPNDDPYIRERYGRFPKNIIWSLYVRFIRTQIRRDNPFHNADIVFANSRWTANVVREIYGEEPVVLNPPIPPNVGLAKEPKPFEEREPLVVMVGRFSEEKRYHWVVTEVMPKLVKEVPGTKLIIVGGLMQRAYFDRIRSLVKKNGLTRNVELMPDAPRWVINEIMDRAKVFFHAMINEHWGIAVAEAMARALPPVVHKSGGAWTDVVEEGKYGMGYETTDEAVEALAKLLTDKKTWQIITQVILTRVSELTLEKFTERLSRYLT